MAVQYRVHICSTWLPTVTGYNTTDSNNGYAGNFGRPVDRLAIQGGGNYRVHILGGDWLPPVTGFNLCDPENGYAGVTNRVIDAIAIDGGTQYCVHVAGSNPRWLSPVTGYNTDDAENGFSGEFGQPIDAVAIFGRTYCTSQSGGLWLPPVSGNDINDSVNGYAGLRGMYVDGIAIAGNVQYCVHVTGSNPRWLSPVTGYNTDDAENGFSGEFGQPIDAVAINGAEYRVSLCGGNWQPAVVGYNLLDSEDGYAGVLGTPIDSIAISGGYPFEFRTLKHIVNQWNIPPAGSFKHGCELCALSEALQMLGFQISGPELWAGKGIVPRSTDLRKGYINSPTGEGACHAPVMKQIVDNLRTLWNLPLHAMVTNEPLPALQRYLNQGSSIVWWATCGPGRLNTFPPYQANLHVMALVRCTDKEVQYRDTWVGEERISSSMDRITSAYQALGSQAVVISLDQSIPDYPPNILKDILNQFQLPFMDGSFNLYEQSFSVINFQVKGLSVEVCVNTRLSTTYSPASFGITGDKHFGTLCCNITGSRVKEYKPAQGLGERLVGKTITPTELAGVIREGNFTVQFGFRVDPDKGLGLILKYQVHIAQQAYSTKYATCIELLFALYLNTTLSTAQVFEKFLVELLALLKINPLSQQQKIVIGGATFGAILLLQEVAPAVAMEGAFVATVGSLLEVFN